MSIQHDSVPAAERPNELPPDLERQVALAKQERAYVVNAPPAPAPEQHLPQPTRADEYSPALAQAYERVGTLVLTKEESEALMAPFPDEDVQIKPSGQVYIPHILISDRLTRILGPGQWGMVRRPEKIADGIMFAEYVLVIRGVFIGEGYGAQEYHANNPQTNFRDTLEGTQGEALRAICGKRLCCGSQVWNPTYIESWKAKYATSSWTTNRKGQRVLAWEKKQNPATRTEMPLERIQSAKPVSDSGTLAKAVPAASQTPPRANEPEPASSESPEAKRERWLKLLRPLEPVATQLLVESGVLMPNETIEDLPASKVPLTKGVAQHFLEQCRVRIDGIQVEPAPEVTTSDTVCDPPPSPSSDNHEEEWWYKFAVPFGKDKGCPLGKLDKKTLYGWWANYQPEPRTDKNGKTWPVSQSDRDFRRALDFIGSHYEFTKKD